MANIFKFRVTNKVENTLGLGIGNYIAGDTIYANEKLLSTASFRNAIQKGYLEPAGEDDSKVSDIMMDYYNGTQGVGKNYFPVSSVELVQPLAAAGLVNTQATDLCGDLKLNKRVAIDKILARFSTASTTAAMPRLLAVAGNSSAVTPSILTSYDYTAGTYTAATNGSIAAASPITWAANDMLIVGYTEKFASMQCDMTAASTITNTATAYYWDGDSWAAFPTFTDYTAETSTRTLSRASALDKTRMVWWETPDDWVAGGPNGSGATSSDYCIAIKFSAALTTLAGCSVYPILDTPIADLQLGTNEWIPKAVVMKLGTAYTDITSTSPATLNSFTTTDYLWLGFDQKVASFYVDVTNTNSNASTAVLTYWNGESWVSAKNVTDGSASGGVTFAQDGAISMVIPEDWERAVATNTSSGFPGVNNVPTTITSNELFWVRYTTSAAFDGSVTAAFNVNTGMPATNHWYEFETAQQSYVDADASIKVIVAEPEANIAGLTIQAIIEDI